MEPFISVSPKEPLVNMEGPPGISSPIRQPSEGRRFSIRPAQLSAQVSPTSTKSTPTPLQTPKALPRWKAGMLQRQISQMNLCRRARAFSLSDVHSDRREKSTTPLSPLAMGNTIRSIDKTNQKTVTIVSPAKEITATSELQSIFATAASSRSERAPLWNSDQQQGATWSSNPFASGIPGEPPAALNESTVSDVQDGRHLLRDRNFVPIYEPVYKLTAPERKPLFEQKLMKLDDTSTRSVQTGTQETNVDVAAASLNIQERRNDTRTCVIENLDDPQEAKSSTAIDSLVQRRGKPSVPIDPYQPPLQVTIEKPAINPFEQYRAMTRSQDHHKEDHRGDQS